jgi:hypothetical protein
MAAAKQPALKVEDAKSHPSGAKAHNYLPHLQHD